MPFSKHSRILYLQKSLRSIDVDALLLSDRANILYLTGFYISGVSLLIPRLDKPVYFSDRMNFSLVGNSVKNKNFTVARGNTIADILDHIFSKKIGKIGIYPRYFDLDRYLAMRNKNGLKLLTVQNDVERMRSVKSAEEIVFLRTAAKATVKIWKYIEKRIAYGMTEIEISTMLDTRIRELGYQNSFPSIVAAGPNSAHPHAVPTKKKLKNGEFVLLDFGIKYMDYSSDLTRIWHEGRMGRTLGAFYDAVRAVSDDAIRDLRPGVKIGNLVKKSYKRFLDSGLNGYIRHSLGHGVGLDIHEEPFLRENSEDILEKGMVVTIEPGLYKPKVGGIRWEDMVLITKNGCEVLTV
ncbi:MAG: aminopeptidase P family protein [Candidatus Omnitrophica bacterium]|nr:aminopeptidase P family protein [Candidatus Omnitrophota bacterium]